MQKNPEYCEIVRPVILTEAAIFLQRGIREYRKALGLSVSDVPRNVYIPAMLADPLPGVNAFINL